MIKHLLILILSSITFFTFGQSSKKKNNNSNAVSVKKDSLFADFKFRNIGPAFMSGRIADIKIHPKDENVWYVAVGSGGVWKTMNAGTTWTPIFDKQTSYSIGCVTIDPNNPHVIWVGTGENVGGRHVGYGDGIYKSEDGGNTWKNMGLKNSEHISEIIIHPNNSDKVWVAVQGPLWKAGDQRGLYKTTNGGKTWNKTLGNNKWTGVTDIAIDPRNPNVLYAATWDRHRTVAAYLGGGPGSGIHKSADGGETWKKLSNGLPTSNMGKIGIAISPMKPDIIYAAIELDRKTGGVFKSLDKGETWEKQSDAVAGATGPHYYQELYASPHRFDRLYLVDAWMQYSDDGGKTFKRQNPEHKHGDNHAIAFKPSDPNYILVGTDGGIYESFDGEANWRYMPNLPVTQFYKVAVDDAEPFYNIYGGTQDNSTQGGPSRTDNVQGIQNSDWRVVLNWDGHQPATEPGNPNIMYAERQEGNISRIDLKTGEVIDIQPQPGEGEPHERYNWDAPILVSPHSPTTIFFGSYRVWKSNNRGDTWKAISGDLTKNQNRITLPIMGRTQSWDNAWDFAAMSNYNTITSLSESPVKEGVIYAGTDDGLIQVTENNGESWRKIGVNNLPGVPSTAFVNDIKADNFDENTVYVVLDNHKFGDYNPYLYKSTDKGRTWQSMMSNLPKRTLLWRIVQDHKNDNLFFLGTEYGIYFTTNKGKNWLKFSNMPTISFRDLAIQKRENDLVGASFGRGFFVLDDYSPLRMVSDETFDEEAVLFPTRKAYWYIPRSHISFDKEKGSLGASHYVAPNPEFGATFTYYLKNSLTTDKKMRQKNEKKISESQNINFHGYDKMSKESYQIAPKVWITITNKEGKVIRRVEGSTVAGFHRTTWDLRYPVLSPVILDYKPSPYYEPQGFLAPPGEYFATLSKTVDGKTTVLSDSIKFVVEPLREPTLKGEGYDNYSSFLRSFEQVIDDAESIDLKTKRLEKRIKGIYQALQNAPVSPGEFDKIYFDLNNDFNEYKNNVYGNSAKIEVGEKTKPTVGERIFAIYRGVSNSTYGPTSTHKQTMEIIKKSIVEIQTNVDSLNSRVEKLINELHEVGGPWVEE